MENKSNLGLDKVLFLYSSKHLTGSRKVRFFYALKGREKNPGLVDKKSVISVSKKILLVSAEKKEYVKSFLDFWACKYELFEKPDLVKKLILKYDTSGLSSAELVRFFYALKGRRTSRGILKETNSEQLAKSVIFVPISKLNQITQFFSYWNLKIEEVRLGNE